jgi:hypothetical protein
MWRLPPRAKILSIQKCPRSRVKESGHLFHFRVACSRFERKNSTPAFGEGTWASKGEVLARLLAARSEPDFIFAAGDNRTDEDLFERLEIDAWTVHVGPGSTRASYVVPDFEGLRQVLKLFAESGNARKAC